jgi:uncharacterized protein (DUF302 family)
MNERCRYGFGKTVGLSCDSALRKVRDSLRQRGFDILFEREVGDIWKNGEGSSSRYVVLGACNPRLASRAHAADPDIGLIIPIHLAVYEDNRGKTKVMVTDPAVFMDLMKRQAAIEMAIVMKDELESLMEAIG